LGIGGNRIIHDAPGGGDHLHPSDEGYPPDGRYHRSGAVRLEFVTK